ncbi:MAG: alpha/beta family hydrolase [Candidatus Neomarinimicrobiota bacterium]|jgi:hypothetical protein|nr:hypothetical protein [Candidatus Neomarinimicrobiota bacterium]MDD3965574.1 hypothetical protein [Candidatus Neomarinimicrobiota bacterium]MDX9780422.1 hypothetical protein [bacterium]
MREIRNIIYPFKKAETLISYNLPDLPSDVTLVLGHGRYNDMNQPLLKALAELLPKENVNLVRFNFPFVENPYVGISKCRCNAVYEMVLEDVKSELSASKFCFIGGKSLSAVISARIAPEYVNGYVFLTWPLHSPRLRIPFSRKALFLLKKPMIFVSGTEDPFCDRGKLELLSGALNPYARLMLVPQTDHSLELLREGKRTQDEIHREIADVLLWFMSDVIEKQTKKN